MFSWENISYANGALIYFVIMMTDKNIPALPIMEHRAKILLCLKLSKSAIISAPTGSGKSTQVPQFLIDSGMVEGQILILQPRRLAARMLAERVAFERNAILGDEIGFVTRFESKQGDNTRALFITEGVLPRMMLTNKDLKGVSAIIFDEFHERNLATDLGLALVRTLQQTTRPDLAIIIMSATMDAHAVSEYCGNASIISASGRTFPIDIQYALHEKKLPVWDMVAMECDRLLSLKVDGDILVFMPGVYEIRRSVDAISRYCKSEPLCVMPLYGDLPSQKQHDVMGACTKRKIIVATNIAETSITIPGVCHVIDSGLARVNRYDPCRGFNTLYMEPISIDSADQRAGRAGRQASGVCVRLWTKQYHEGRKQRITPEILRVDLSETLLFVRMLGYNRASQFPWFEKPANGSLEAAEKLLRDIGAIGPDGNLCNAGREMSAFPMHPRLSRLLLEASKRHCVTIACFSAAYLSERPAVFGKPEYPQQAYEHELSSDFYGLFCLMEKIKQSNFDAAVCLRYNVNAGAAKGIVRTQALFLHYCRRFGMPTHDQGDSVTSLAQCLLLAYPDHCAVRKDTATLLCTMRDNRTGELAKDSLARGAEFLIAADIRETKERNHEMKTVLSLATEIKKEWLYEYFPDAWNSKSFHQWEPQSQSIENVEITECFGVVVEKKTCVKNLDISRASSILADVILKKELKLAGWGQAANEWIGRVTWVGCQFPHHGLPTFTEEERALVVHAMCEGEYKYGAVSNKDALPYLKQLVSAEQLRFVDVMAPEVLILPSKRKLRLFYEPAQPPTGRCRIQDLYGLPATPRIAQNRIAVRIEILAPNNRPVQITDDLARFWQEHYPGIKKSLSRRYPRHEWR